jgi:hypothetical protein
MPQLQCGYLEKTRRTPIAKLTEMWDGRGRSTGGDPADPLVDPLVAAGSIEGEVGRRMAHLASSMGRSAEPY